MDLTNMEEVNFDYVISVRFWYVICRETAAEIFIRKASAKL